MVTNPGKMPLFFAAALLLALFTACTPRQELRLRTVELCRHIPNPECLERSQGFLTPDYYAALEAVFTAPDSVPLLHEWEFWFAAADGSPIAEINCKVRSVRPIDSLHALARLLIHPADQDYPPEVHLLRLEKQDGIWLISDFDDTYAAALRRLMK